MGRTWCGVGTGALIPCLLLGAGLSLWTAGQVGADQPRIDHIEKFRFGSNQVLIHFDTEPNRTYTLQYNGRLGPTATGSWSNLFVAPKLPIPNHYVILDTNSSPQRFYRLSVVP